MRLVLSLFVLLCVDTRALLEPRPRDAPPPKSDIDVDSGSGKPVLVVLPIKVVTAGVTDPTSFVALDSRVDALIDRGCHRRKR